LSGAPARPVSYSRTTGSSSRNTSKSPGNIEIQIIADGHGNILALGSAKCSISAAAPEIVEEAPSPFVDEVTRRPWASRPWPSPGR